MALAIPESAYKTNNYVLEQRVMIVHIKIFNLTRPDLVAMVSGFGRISVPVHIQSDL